MAFTDQSVTVGGVTTPLPRTGMGLLDGSFTSNDGLISMRVSHAKGAKRTRHIIRLDVAKVAADPFQTAVNAKYSMSAQIHVDVPVYGFVVADQKAVLDALIANLSANSGANETRLLGGEV